MVLGLQPSDTSVLQDTWPPKSFALVSNDSLARPACSSLSPRTVLPLPNVKLTSFR